MDFFDALGGFFDEGVHFGLGEVDHRAGAHGVYFFVTALVEGFDVAELMEQGLVGEKIQIGRMGFGGGDGLLHGMKIGMRVRR